MTISCFLLLLYAAGSCANRCDAPFHDNTGGCYCHETCMFTDDCCDDYKTVCREATIQPFWSVFFCKFILRVANKRFHVITNYSQIIILVTSG